jgi:hypothetical protein
MVLEYKIPFQDKLPETEFKSFVFNQMASKKAFKTTKI